METKETELIFVHVLFGSLYVLHDSLFCYLRSVWSMKHAVKAGGCSLRLQV